jgi:hypothetical protein
MSKDNAKLPPSPHHNESGTAKTLYADSFQKYETCHHGTLTSHYRDTGGSNSFNSHAGPTGDIHYQDENGGEKPISVTAHPGAFRHYVNNHSDHADGNREAYSGGVHNQGSVGEMSTTTSDHMTSGTAKTRAELHSNRASIRATSEDIDASSQGITVQSQDGDRYNFHQKDVATTYGGSHYEIVQGDHGIHVQGSGNLDYRIEGGKTQIYSGSDMTIISKSKITLKVGSSTIVMEDGKITVTTGSVKFVKA